MRYFPLFIMMAALPVTAQQWEDFSDEDMTHDPQWRGELLKFKFSSSSAVPELQRPALQLNGSGADSAWLSFEQGNFPAMQWDFWVKLSFNTSSGNYSRIYLGCDSEDPREAKEAFYLQIGGADDSVWFVRQDSGTVEPLYRIPLMYTGNSTNSLRMRVIRSPDGLWGFSGDPSGAGSLQDLGMAAAPGKEPGIHFGLFCHFTSSNSTKIYFDDIYCGPEIIDSVPPELQEVSIVTQTELMLRFNEPVLEADAAINGNYWLTGGIGHPREAYRMMEPSDIMLFFEEEMISGMVYNLKVSGIHDPSGNEMETVSCDLIYYLPEPSDVIITEIMADPSPPVLLPEFEYLEILNRSLCPIDLTGWKLVIGGNSYFVSGAWIGPGEYMVLVDEDYIPGYTQFGRVAGLSSLSISNDGAAIILQDTSGRTISHTAYHPDKFGDAAKAQGGWSLERSDPLQPCRDEGTWAASSDPSGGTPGRKNTGHYVDVIPPDLTTICCTDSSSVRLKFSQAMDPVSMLDPSNYSADRGLGHPCAVCLADEMGMLVDLTFAEKILPMERYLIQVNTGLRDCEGNEGLSGLSGPFSQPSPSEPFDVVFNEILFNPLSDGAEYIELFNRSDKTIHLDDLFLALIRESAPNPPDTELYAVSELCRPLFPDSYAVLSKYPEKVAEQYYSSNPESFIKMTSFPMLTNEGGTLRLMDGERNTIDGLDYSEMMHYPLLNTFTGIALERVSPDVAGTSPGNWHSASSGCGYGTPGYVNSQFQENVTTESALELLSIAFTPNGDGRDDLLGISCHFDEPGMLVSLFIFSENGRLVRRLAEGYLAGSENRFNWDGTTDEGHRAAEGVYVVLLEAMSMNGYSNRFKKAVVLGYGE